MHFSIFRAKSTVICLVIFHTQHRQTLRQEKEIKKKRQIYLHHQVSQLTSTLSLLSVQLLYRVELQEDIGCVCMCEFEKRKQFFLIHISRRLRSNDLAAALKFNLPIEDKVIAIARDT